MKKTAQLWLAALFALMGCGNTVQKEIEKWNTAFGAQKNACERGDLVACQNACQMSRSPSVCTAVAKIADMNDPKQREWVARCPANAASDGLTCCQSAVAAGLPEVPAEAPLRTPQPVSATPIAQNTARFERIPGRGTLPAVGEPVVTEQNVPGPAFFATNGSGLVKLDKNGFSTVFAEPKDLLKVIPGLEGSLWLLAYGAVYRLENNTLDTFQGEGQSTGFEKIAVDLKGDIWIIGLYGISRFNGKTWDLYLKKNLTGETHTPFYSISADNGGRIWVTAHEAVYVFDKGQWRALAMNPDPRENKMYLGPAAVANKNLYVQATGGLLQISSEDWMQLSGDGDFFSANHIDIRNNKLFAASYKDVRVFPLDGSEPIGKFKGEGIDFPSTTIRAFAADGQGRIWLAGDEGPVVIHNGGKVFHWPPGSVNALRARVTDIYVVGNGPQLPAAVGPVQTSPVIGKMIFNGKPSAEVEIEICPGASNLMRKTPCEGQPFQGKSITKADGTFRIENVPLVTMQLAYRQKGAEKWTVPMGSWGQERESGKVHNLGNVEITKGSTVFLFRE